MNRTFSALKRFSSNSSHGSKYVQSYMRIGGRILCANSSSDVRESPHSVYHQLVVTRESRPYVTHIELNRPEKKNAISLAMWDEIGRALNVAAQDSRCRAVVLTSAGTNFSAGIDLTDLSKLSSVVTDNSLDVSAKVKQLYALIRRLQSSFTSAEKCNKPVICAVQGPCVGAGVNLITATDIRLCTKDAWFQVKEVDMGLAADVGALQRLPKVIGSQSLVRDLCLTARRMHSDEAKSSGLVSNVYEDIDSMREAAFNIASDIADKSPVAVQGTKLVLNHARDASVDDGLDFVARHNAMMLQSKDLLNSVMAAMSKQKAEFDDL